MKREEIRRKLWVDAYRLAAEKSFMPVESADEALAAFDKQFPGSNPEEQKPNDPELLDGENEPGALKIKLDHLRCVPVHEDLAECMTTVIENGPADANTILIIAVKREW